MKTYHFLVDGLICWFIVVSLDSAQAFITSNAHNSAPLNVPDSQKSLHLVACPTSVALQGLLPFIDQMAAGFRP